MYNNFLKKGVILSFSLILMVTLFSGCFSMLIKKSDVHKSWFDERQELADATIDYKLKDGVHVIHLSGSDYAMGYKYGEKMKELDIDKIYDMLFNNLASMYGGGLKDKAKYLKSSHVIDILYDAWMTMDPYVPPYFNRMLQGFADGSGLPLREIQAVQAVGDFTETSCSAMWATGSATTNGQTFQIRLLDYIMGLGIQETPSVVFWEFEQGHMVANVGWLGFVSLVSGSSDADLAVSEMGYGNPDGENLHGIPMPVQLFDILRWADIPEEASGIIKSGQRTNSYAYIVGTKDFSALGYALDAYSVEIIEPGEKHELVPQFKDVAHAGHYPVKMYDLIEKNHGKMDIEWLKKEFIPQIAMDSNLQSVIYDLENRKILVANAKGKEVRGADQPYVEVEFPKKKLGASNKGKTDSGKEMAIDIYDGK